MNVTFPVFAKIPRFDRDVIVTEKIDGTNGLVSIEELTGQRIEDGVTLVDMSGDYWEANPIVYGIRAGSRTRWITPEADNFGFAKWVQGNAQELVKLGPGLHYGEWYGHGIQRGYGLSEKRFALFNSYRWADPEVRPKCCDVVPVLASVTGSELTWTIQDALHDLHVGGSRIAPGFMNPEGVVLYHTAAGQYFKVTLEKDAKPKSEYTLAA